MKKVLLWTVGGFGLATGCGFAGLPHLSASIITLTVFCSVPALLVVALNAISGNRKAHT